MLICRTLESIVWTLSNIFLMGDCPIDTLKGFICPQCLLYEGEILNYDTLLCSPRVGGEFTPRIYNYIFLPPTPHPLPPPYYSSITTLVSRAWQKVPWGRLHRGWFEGFTPLWNPDRGSVLAHMKIPSKWDPNVSVSMRIRKQFCAGAKPLVGPLHPLMHPLVRDPWWLCNVSKLVTH